MRRMYVAAKNGEWERVDHLDQQRIEFLDAMQTAPDVAVCYDRASISEILELDHAVLNLANQSMQLVANYTLPV